jgi:ammonium transporter Rh
MVSFDLDDMREYAKAWLKKYMFPAGLVLFQSVFIVLYAVHAEYDVKSADHPTGNHSSTARSGDGDGASGASELFYPFFQDVHVMMFIGFGFLMTFLRRYSFSSVSFNFLVAAFVLEWAILIRGYSFEWDAHTHSFAVNVKSLLHADFVCAAILISFGAVLGKTNPAQLVVMAVIEVVIQVWNEYVGLIYFCTYDAGE